GFLRGAGAVTAGEPFQYRAVLVLRCIHALRTLVRRERFGKADDFVDDAEAALVMHQPAVGGDLGVYASPELDVGLDLRCSGKRTLGSTGGCNREPAKQRRQQTMRQIPQRHHARAPDFHGLPLMSTELTDTRPMPSGWTVTTTACAGDIDRVCSTEFASPELTSVILTNARPRYCVPLHTYRTATASQIVSPLTGFSGPHRPSADGGIVLAPSLRKAGGVSATGYVKQQSSRKQADHGQESHIANLVVTACRPSVGYADQPER